MGEQLNKRTATAALVELCVSYLLSLESPVLPDRVGELYPFARYSAQYWSHYASVVEKCPSSNHDVLATVWEFYACQDKFRQICQLSPLDHPEGYHGKDVVSPLYYASYAGLPNSVHQLLLMTEADVNSRCGFLGTALQAASYQGHLDTVNVLLEYGARVNEQGGHYGNALQAASIAGHEAIVRRLMQEGADVNRQSSHYEIKSALIAASKGVHAAIVQMLLEYGADVNRLEKQVGWAYQDDKTPKMPVEDSYVAG